MKLVRPKSFVTIHESVESPKPWSWRVARNYSTFFCFTLFILSNPMWWKQISWSLYRQSTSTPSLEKWYICVHVFMGDHLTMTNSRMEIRIVGCNVAIILSYGESWWLFFFFPPWLICVLFGTKTKILLGSSLVGPAMVGSKGYFTLEKLGEPISYQYMCISPSIEISQTFFIKKYILKHFIKFFFSIWMILHYWIYYFIFCCILNMLWNGCFKLWIRTKAPTKKFIENLDFEGWPKKVFKRDMHQSIWLCNIHYIALMFLWMPMKCHTWSY